MVLVRIVSHNLEEPRTLARIIFDVGSSFVELL